MTLAELAASAHADATRRGIYPQGSLATIADVVDEAMEAYEAEGTEHLPEERADVLIATLSAMHDAGIDPDQVVAAKMAHNRTRKGRH